MAPSLLAAAACDVVMYDVRAVKKWNGLAKACMKKCHCTKPLIFWAKTEAARSLYQGCSPSGAGYGVGPSLIVIGAVKGGTTSLQANNPQRLCFAGGEPNFWSAKRWENRSVDRASLRSYMGRIKERCTKKEALLAEKSPWYLANGASHLRICEALPGQKLLLLLREPVARAYSNFYEERKQRRMLPSVPELPNDREGFHRQVTLEIAVAKSCGGMPMGDPDKDRAAQWGFEECCRAVAKNFSFSFWPGCESELLLPPDLPERVRTASRWYGEQAYKIVRYGAYAPMLRNWYRYHQPSDLLLLFSEDFFEEMPRSLCQLHCHLDPAGAKKKCGKAKEDWSSPRKHQASSGHPPMRKTTRRLLQEFYAPYNEELNRLLGRKAPWS